MWWFTKRQPEFFLSASESLLLIHMRLGKKWFHNAMQCVLNEETREILIGDICIGSQSSYIRHTNKGYGSQMMKLLLDYAKEHAYHTITGWLAPFDSGSQEDPEHRIRQIHFYNKFGFKILPNEENPESIELYL